MPYENEHSARLLDPNTAHIRVRQTAGSGDGNVQGVKVPKSIAVIWYIIKKDDKEVPVAQALRFPTSRWTESKARAWLKKNKIKYLVFEAAKDSKSGNDAFEPAKNAQMESDGANQLIPEGHRRAWLAPQDAELRILADDTPTKIVGYAAKYGKWSLDLGGFKEKIQAGAFDEAIKRCDIRALKNHNNDLLLGRTSSKTLRLSSNSVGLRFELDVPNTTTGRDTLEEVRRHDLSGCSFSFTVAKDKRKHEDGGLVERTITEFDEIFDIGPVVWPAYPDTTVSTRAMCIFADSIGNDDTTETISLPKNTEIRSDQALDVDISGEQQSEKRTEQDPASEILDPETQRLYDRKYRTAGRIINRCRPAES